MGSARWAQPPSDGRGGQWERGQRPGRRGVGGGGGAAAVARATLADGGTAALRCLRSPDGLKRALNTAPPTPRRGGRRRQQPRRGPRRGGRGGETRRSGSSRLRPAAFCQRLRARRVLPRRPQIPPSFHPPRPPPSPRFPPEAGKETSPKVTTGRRTTTWPPRRRRRPARLPSAGPCGLPAGGGRRQRPWRCGGGGSGDGQRRRPPSPAFAIPVGKGRPNTPPHTPPPARLPQPAEGAAAFVRPGPGG